MSTATIPLIRSHGLVDVALRLASPAPDGGEPSPEQVRRSVSTAYYALFHELVAHAAAELCGDNPDSIAERRTVARWFGHADLRLLAEAVSRTASGGISGAVASVIGKAHPSLKELADTFVELQKERNHADYDHESVFDPLMALDIVFQAALAIALARQLADSRDPSYLRFLRLMVGAVKIARTRTS
jgi:hypothetical protein